MLQTESLPTRGRSFTIRTKIRKGGPTSQNPSKGSAQKKVQAAKTTAQPAMQTQAWSTDGDEAIGLAEVERVQGHGH